MNNYFLAEFYDPETGESRPDSALESTARRVLRESYDLRPMGSETREELENRIIGVFLERYGWNWNADTPKNEIIGDVNFHRVVAEISPLSSRKVRFEEVTTEPAPQAAEAPWMTFKQAVALVEKLFGAYSREQQRAMAEELIKRQQRGEKNYVPPGAESDFGGLAIPGMILGGGLILGAAAYFMFKK